MRIETYFEFFIVFTQFRILSEKPPDGHMWAGRRLTKMQETTRLDNLWPEFLFKNVKKQLNQEKVFNELSRNRSSTMPESREASVLSSRKIISIGSQELTNVSQ